MRTSKKYAGCLFAQAVNADGSAAGTIFKFGNAYPLTLQMTVKTAEQNSALCDSPGQLLEAFNELDNVSGELTLYQYGAKEIGIALGADPAAMTGTGGTTTAATITAPAADVWFETGQKRMTSFTLTDVGATETYVAGTDYLVNLQLGIWTPISGGSIVAASSVAWSCTYAAESGFKLEMATVLQHHLRIFGSLKEIRTGATFDINMKRVLLTSKDGVTVISDPKTEFESLAFDLTLLTPSGHTTPATIEGIGEN